ncbi:hypothetical protein SO802_029861 [Lithocarpus litseifolius]|uniref:Uncharacterized protein n=1 Tax=Lithocarpus litseifolius TaxID=425828 RepID=A0AAW2BUV5_9ROSI
MTPLDSFAPSTSAPSSSVGGVPFEAIMAQLLRIDARLDTFSDELCQASEDESDDDGSGSDNANEDGGASFSDDNEMTASQ